ncbi:MAG: hypothetical protein PWR10_1819 [Halanaerobiales bacterium]|nr:hypothetical protein [Halanaerobiales bacterium]
MRKTKTLAEKKHTFCLDCSEDPQTCGKNPLDCMKEAQLYFKMYDKTAGYKTAD